MSYNTDAAAEFMDVDLIRMETDRHIHNMVDMGTCAEIEIRLEDSEPWDEVVWLNIQEMTLTAGKTIWVK